MGQYAGSLYEKELADGRVIVVYRMLYTTRICIGPSGWQVYDDFWCYEAELLALAAAASWDGEGDPADGWIKHGGTGRRRPNGDPTKEYVMP